MVLANLILPMYLILLTKLLNDMVDRLLNFSPLHERSMKCIASAVIGALGSVAAGAVSSAISGNNSRQAVREQNEYNKPINQRARFEEAGLNPYLAMGSGALGAGNQTAAADMSGANNAMANGLLSGMQQIGQLGLLKSQIDNQKADAANKIEEAKGRAIDNKTKEAKNVAELAILQEQQKDWKFKVDSVNPQTLQKGKAEIDLLIQKYKSEIQNTDNLQELGKKIISETRLNNLKGDEQQAVNDQIVSYLTLQRQMIRMEISTGYQNAKSNEISANANATSANAAMKNAETNEKVGKEEVALKKAQTNGQKWGNQFSARTLHQRVGLVDNSLEFSNLQLGDYNIDAWSRRVGTALNGGSEVYNAYSNGRLVDSQIESNKSSHYGNTPYNETTEHYNSKGKMTKKTVKKGVRIGRLK